jgi:UDP-N-acetylglucosamine diphosphorylase/glucosamine-1-phosphate N-acetyltransferase
MAGGLGKRMNSDIPKVLHKIKNKPMLISILETALSLNVYKILLVVGKYYNVIKNGISEYINQEIIDSKINYVIQNEALGTGHAIMCCKNILGKLPMSIESICILSGDVPLISSETINNLLNNTEFCKILIANLSNPHGYGRIKIDNNRIVKIIEEKDCTYDEKKITLINGGIYSFNIKILLTYIDKLDNNNSQKEYYLTQIFELINKDNINIYCNVIEDENEIMGVNTKEQLLIIENYIK